MQAEPLEVPEEFLAPREWRIRRPAPEEEDVRAAVAAIRAAEWPVVIAGGGVHYSFATEALAEFAETTGIPVTYTQAGVGVMDWDHPLCLGAVGSTGSTASNAVVADADLGWADDERALLPELVAIEGVERVRRGDPVDGDGLGVGHRRTSLFRAFAQ